MKKIKDLLFNFFIRIYSKRFWIIAGNIAERFYEKDTGEYDDLQEKLYYWITK